MSTLIKYLLAGLTLVILYLLFLTSQKVYVDEEKLDCENIRERLTDFSPQLFDGLSEAPPAYAGLFNCNASFKLINLSNERVKAGYRVKGFNISPGDGTTNGDFRLNFDESDSIMLFPKQSKVIELSIKSHSNSGTMKVKVWVND